MQVVPVVSELLAVEVVVAADSLEVLSSVDPLVELKLCPNQTAVVSSVEELVLVHLSISLVQACFWSAPKSPKEE